jgi:class 3 adenylate cyclase
VKSTQPGAIIRLVESPDTLYALSDGLHIAYQRFGSGPDLIMIPPLVSNVELSWDHELYRRVLELDAQHVRVLMFDKRGIGSSDRFEQQPTLEERIRDIAAVMDAEGIERASLCGLSEGGVMAQLFAAQWPERVEKLVLVNTTSGLSATPLLADFTEPAEQSPDLVYLMTQFEGLVRTWGVDPGFMVEWMMPSQQANPSFVRWVGRLQRQTASPADIQRQIDSILNLDATDRLSEIHSPTLVMHATGDRVLHPSMGRFLASRIEGSRYVEVPGDDHFLWVMPNWRQIIDTILEFTVGHPIETATQRRFAAVLFTDLVDSTARTIKAGDHAWRDTLDSHDRICREVVEYHAGRIVKSTGDGLLAIFDSPSQAVNAATDIVSKLGSIDLGVRAGVHAGEFEVRDDGDVTGAAVNIAARVEQSSALGEVYVSSTVRDMLLGGEHRFAERGEHQLKGVEGSWKLYAVER